MSSFRGSLSQRFPSSCRRHWCSFQRSSSIGRSPTPCTGALNDLTQNVYTTQSFSAFSVASTPISQCSSALSSRHQSLRLDDTRHQSLRADDSLEMMDYETSSPSKEADRRSRRSASRDATPSRELGKSLIGLHLDDAKPPSVSSMLSGRSSMLSGRNSMLSPGAVSPSPQRNGGGPFSSMTFNSAVRKASVAFSEQRSA